MKGKIKMNDQATLESIDTKLDMFMESQSKVNLMFADAHKDIAKTLAKSEAQQIEINNTSLSLLRLTDKVEREADKIADLHSQVSVNSTLVDQTQELKKYFIRGMVGVFLMFVMSIGTQLYKIDYDADGRLAAAIFDITKNQVDRAMTTPVNVDTNKQALKSKLK